MTAILLPAAVSAALVVVFVVVDMIDSGRNP